MRSTVFAVLAVTLAVGLLLARAVPDRLSKPLGVEQAMPLVVESGTNLKALNQRLADDGVVPDAHALYWYARYLGVADRIQAGEYVMSPGMSADDLLDMLVQGDVVQHAFTVVEGWTVAQLRAAMAADDRFEHDTAHLTPEQLLDRLGIDADHPEGLFLPETYFITTGSRESTLLQRAHRALNATLEAAWAMRADALPLDTAYDALILASIVEKETGQAVERPAIAGVFTRRLKEGMRLQTDPTVIYGIGPSFDGDIRRRDLRTDTPYNTYTRHGLPPTPIALAGRAAIEAAVQPLEGDALYFVSRGDGSHSFSATLAEHEAAVRKYQLNQ
ncbi:MAG: endolytic transglycosylase MltG [Pseudomonadota bacterium]